MAFGYQGASHLNDDLNASPDPDALAHAKGYVGGGEFGINNHLTQGASADWSPDGDGNAIVNGWEQAGTNRYDQDVNRDRGMGAAGQGRQSVQLDQGQSNQDRTVQMGALTMMGDAARGNAPSRAAALGQASTDNTIRTGSAMAAGGRGPGGALVAMNSAQGGAAATSAKNNAQITDMRASEIAKAQHDYATGAQGVEGQDIGAATTQANLDANQRALNEQRQQGFERRAWGVRDSQQKAADDYQRQIDAENNTRKREQLAEQAKDDAITDTAINTGYGGAMSLFKMGSDERMKRNVIPVGALAHLVRGRR